MDSLPGPDPKLGYSPLGRRVTGWLSSDGHPGCNQRCVFCRGYYPAGAMLESVPALCLHCAAFDFQTAIDAGSQQRHLGIMEITPLGWGIITQQNEDRNCLECGKAGDQPGPRMLAEARLTGAARYTPSVTLGAAHICLACVLHDLHKRAVELTTAAAAPPPHLPLSAPTATNTTAHTITPRRGGHKPIWDDATHYADGLRKAMRLLLSTKREITRNAVAELFRKSVNQPLQNCDRRRFYDWEKAYGVSFDAIAAEVMAAPCG